MATSQKNSEAGRERTRKTADPTWRTSENIQRAAQSTLDAANEGVRRTTEQFTEVFGLSNATAEQVARQSSQTVEAMAQCGTVLARGAQDISSEWIKLAGDRLQRNLQGLQELAHCRTLPEVVSVQSRLVRENMEQMLNNSRRIAEISLQVTKEASEVAKRDKENTSRVHQAA